TDAFLRTMLARWRGTHSSYLSPFTINVNNLQLFNVRLSHGNAGLHIMRDPTILSPSPLPAATVNTAYLVTIQSSGSQPTWSAGSGLPPGLVLNPSTGVISGTPTSLGSYTFTVSATNANGTGSKQFTVGVGGTSAASP